MTMMAALMIPAQTATAFSHRKSAMTTTFAPAIPAYRDRARLLQRFCAMMATSAHGTPVSTARAFFRPPAMDHSD